MCIIAFINIINHHTCQSKAKNAGCVLTIPVMEYKSFKIKLPDNLEIYLHAFLHFHLF